VNAREVNILLTKAALRDPRMKRVNAAEQKDMAVEWATDLAGVSLDDALEAVRAHYAVSREPIMIADILERCGVVEDPWEHLPDVDAELAPIRRERALEAAGVTEEEFAANWRDPEWRALKFPPQVDGPGWPKEIEGRDQWL